MATKPWEHADLARAALQVIVSDPGLGPDTLSSGRLLANVLEDLLPDAPRERAILVMAAQAGSAQALRAHVTQGVGPAIAIRLTAASLENTAPLDPRACHWVVTELAIALGLARSEDLGLDNRPAANPAESGQRETAVAVLPDAAQGLRWADPVPPPAVLPSPTVAAGSPVPALDATISAAVRPSWSQPAQAARGRRRNPGVNGVAFSPDGQLLATAGGDGTARLWEVATGALLSRLTGHTGQLQSVLFSPDGRLLATAGADDVARLWEVATGAPVRAATRGPAWDVAFSPDGQLLATAGGGRAPAAGVSAAPVTDTAAWLWEVATGRLVRDLVGHTGQVRTVAFSPDGHMLATSARDRTARLWSWRSANAMQCQLSGR